jgi:hypothetical protein
MLLDCVLFLNLNPLFFFSNLRPFFLGLGKFTPMFFGLPCLQLEEKGYFVCGHRVPWHRLTGAFVACNRRDLKSWVGNSSEGPFWMK